MQAIRSQPLGREWKDRLDLSNRKVPELPDATSTTDAWSGSSTP